MSEAGPSVSWIAIFCISFQQQDIL